MDPCLPAVSGRLGLRLSSDTRDLGKRFTSPFYITGVRAVYPTYANNSTETNGIGMDLSKSSALYNSQNDVKVLSIACVCFIKY